MCGLSKILLLFLLCCPLFCCSQNELVDSLEHIVAAGSDPVERADALYELIKIHFRKDPKRSKAYCHQCIEIAQRGGYQQGLSTCYNSLGVIYQFQQELDSAEVLFNKTLEIGQALNDTLLIVKGLNNLGLNRRHAGHYAQAVDYYWRVQRINEQRGDVPGQAKVFTEIGNIYILTKDFGRASDFQQKAKKLFQQIDSKQGVANVDNSLGVIYENLNNIDSALYYYEKSAATKQELQDWFGWTNTKNNICGIYAEKELFSKAISCLEELIPTHKRMKNQNGLAIVLNNIANYYNKLGKRTNDPAMYHKALPYALEALELAEVTNNLSMQQNLCGELSTLYHNLKDYKKAYQYNSKRYDLRDSLVNETRTRQFAEMQTQYETEKKEQQIAFQQLEIDNQNQRIHLQRSWTAAIVAGLLALFGFLFWQNKLKQERLRQQQAMQHQERLLQATVESVEAERKRISKDLHDGIGQQLSGLKMAWQQLSEKWQQQSPEASKKLSELTGVLSGAASEVRNISHQMMPAALRQLGLVAALQDMLQKSFAHTPIEYEFGQLNAEGRFAQNIEIGLYRIAQELVNNIIKHSNAKQVSVELFKTNAQLVLSIEDDGQGFNMDDLENVGNGLTNISSRAKSVKGNVQFEQRSGSGTSATIRVPVG